MKYVITVYRRERGADKSVPQSFVYETENVNDTVATALSAINSRDPLTDIEGSPARRIEWECSCLQKKCGACAMLVCGRPRLACDSRLSEYKGEIILRPLKKFPNVCDLVVDRSVLLENLKTLKLWLACDAELSDKNRELAYDSSECLQCGCCLEVCPNFYAGGEFFGMSAVPVTARLLTEMPPEKREEIARLYKKHVFEGCGKSFACKKICPKNIDTEKMLVNVNALAIWRRKK